MKRFGVFAGLIGLFTLVLIVSSLQRPSSVTTRPEALPSSSPGEGISSSTPQRQAHPPIQSVPAAVPLALARPVAAPMFQLKTLDGQRVSSDSLKGRAAILMFWASWCEVCKKELPNLKTLYEHQNGKLQFLAIGFSDEEEDIRGYVESHEGTFSFPVAYDAGDQISQAFRVKGTPTFYLLNAKGEVVASHLGAGFLNNRNFQDFILSL